MMGKQSISLWFQLLLLLLCQCVASNSAAAAIVKHLPGLPGPLPFYLETGYVGIGEEGVELFYYFVKSERSPEDDPLLLWLTGGPFCSCISALAFENGPFGFKVQELEYNGSLPTLELNPNSWTKVSSIIYLDLPVGTGFSYTTDHSVPRSSDHDQVSQAEEFLRKWLRKHREFLKNPVYLAGDSYSGITIPPILQRLSIGNEKGIEPMLNLKGYILGNPVTDVWYQQNSQIPFAHGMALISDELYQALERSCKGEYYRVDSTNLECKNNLAAFHECLSGLNIHSGEGILDPDCDTSLPKPTMEDISGFAQRRRILFDPPKVDCETYGKQLCAYWANDARVRKALHIREGTAGEWVRCKPWLEYDQDIGSSFEYHVNLSTKGYRSLIYSGDHDFRVPFLGTQAWIRALNYSIVEDWRSWHVEGQVAGYTRTYSNRMTYATLKGGNHIALENKPAEGFAMFKRWIHHELL